MSSLILRDGRILELTTEQSEKLGMVILFSADLERKVKIGGEKFKLSDIVTDPEEIQHIAQQKMFDVPTVPVATKRKKGKVDRLA